MKKKVAIIGANSFLAKNLYQFLVQRNERTDMCLYDIQETFSLSAEANYRQIDFTNDTDLKKIDFNADAIFIFLGLTGTVNSLISYKAFIEVNEITLLNILEAYRQSASKGKIIYPSTRLLYRGDTGESVHECAPKECRSVYAVTKYAAEKYIEMYHLLYDMPYCIFRICTVYGNLLSEHGNYGTISFFEKQAETEKVITIYGDGAIKKTYTHMKDICEIFAECIENEHLTNNTFNIGGDEKSLQEIGEKIAEKHNVKVKNVEWPEMEKKVDGGSVIFDSSRLDNLIGHKYKKLD